MESILPAIFVCNNSSLNHTKKKKTNIKSNYYILIHLFTMLNLWYFIKKNTYERKTNQTD